MDDEESIGVWYDLIDYILYIMDELAATRAELDKVKRQLNPWGAADASWKADPGWFLGLEDDLPPPGR